MKLFELNKLGKDWIWKAKSKEEATKMFIKEVGSFETEEEYEHYCATCAINPEIVWEEVEDPDGCTQCGGTGCNYCLMCER